MLCTVEGRVLHVENDCLDWKNESLNNGAILLHLGKLETMVIKTPVNAFLKSETVKAGSAAAIKIEHRVFKGKDGQLITINDMVG